MKLLARTPPGVREGGEPPSFRPVRSSRSLSEARRSRLGLLDQADEPEEDMGSHDHRRDADDHESRRSVLAHPPSPGWRMEFDPHGHAKWIRTKARSCQLVYSKTAR